MALTDGSLQAGEQNVGAIICQNRIPVLAFSFDRSATLGGLPGDKVRDKLRNILVTLYRAKEKGFFYLDSP
jgi:hypothetical protein